MKKKSRNELCSCGSKKKFKRCCALKTGLQKYCAKHVTSSKVSSSITQKISSFSCDKPINLAARLQKPIQ